MCGVWGGGGGGGLRHFFSERHLRRKSRKSKCVGVLTSRTFLTSKKKKKKKNYIISTKIHPTPQNVGGAHDTTTSQRPHFLFSTHALQADCSRFLYKLLDHRCKKMVVELKFGTLMIITAKQQSYISLDFTFHLEGRDINQNNGNVKM